MTETMDAGTMNDDANDPVSNEREEPRSRAFPPPPPPPPARSWWHVPIARDRDHGRVGGVLAGVCRAYGFDVRTTRIATVIAAFLAPGTIALYVVAMLLLPRDGEQPRSLHQILNERRKRPLLIILAVAAVATGFGSWAFFGGLGWGLALLGIGVVLWLSPNFGSKSRDAAGSATVPPPPPPPSWTMPNTVAAADAASPTTATATNDAVWTTASGIAASDAARRSADTARLLAPPMTTTSATGPRSSTAVKPPRRKRYPVQAIGLGVATITAIVLAIGNNADWWYVPIFNVVATVMITLITATVAGVIINRSWFGIPMLLLLSAWTVGLFVTHPRLEGGIGSRTARPTTLADAVEVEHLGIGRLTIDLTAVPGTDPLTVHATVGYGQLRVIVPADAAVRVVTDLNAGHVVVNGDETAAGLRRDDVVTIPARSGATEQPARAITLDLELGAGEVRVDQRG
jgi:phage shock protein PspC (stress-responsive transcriptional regulator)